VCRRRPGRFIRVLGCANCLRVSYVIVNSACCVERGSPPGCVARRSPAPSASLAFSFSYSSFSNVSHQATTATGATRVVTSCHVTHLTRHTAANQPPRSYCITWSDCPLRPLTSRLSPLVGSRKTQRQLRIHPEQRSRFAPVSLAPMDEPALSRGADGAGVMDCAGPLPYRCRSDAWCRCGCSFPLSCKSSVPTGQRTCKATAPPHLWLWLRHGPCGLRPRSLRQQQPRRRRRGARRRAS
jgi:hypothetical protein